MLYDLSQPVTNGMPAYPGDPPTVVETAGTLAREGYFDHKLVFGTHVGTHIDAPAHMLAQGKQLKEYPLERFVVDAICLDARTGFDVAEIEAKAQEWQAVLFYTGFGEQFDSPRYWDDHPVLDHAAVQALIAKQVGIVGLDTASADIVDDFPVHKALLNADILIIENLTNLEPLVGQNFKLYAFPIKLEQDGAPVRAIAEL